MDEAADICILLQKLILEHSAPAVSLPSQESDWIDFN